MLNLMTWPRNPWSIFDELEALQQQANRAWSGGRGRSWRRGASYPLMNVWSNKDGIVIDAELPGIDPQDVDISVKGDELTLKGKVNTTKPVEQVSYLRQERPAGEFERLLRLPFKAETGAVKASYRNGILRLTVPRSEDEKPKKIAIEAH